MSGPIVVSKSDEGGYFWTAFGVSKKSILQYVPDERYLSICKVGGIFYISNHTFYGSFYETDDFWVDPAVVDSAHMIPVWAVISKKGRRWDQEREGYVHDLYLRRRKRWSEGYSWTKCAAKKALKSVMEEIKKGEEK